MDSRDDRIKQYKLQENTGALHQLKKNPKSFSESIPVKLLKKIKVSPDTFIFTFELKDNLTLGINIGQHIAIDANINTEEEPKGEIISRKYTPCSWIFDQGTFEILMKVYYKNEQNSGGYLTQWMDQVNIDDLVDIRGPMGKLTYLGDGAFDIVRNFKPMTIQKKIYKKIGMLCVGTGIAPMYQILLSAEKNKDLAEFTLIFGNKTEDDILMKEELEKMGDENWKGSKGRIGKELIAEYCPANTDDTMILICGTKDFDGSMQEILKEMGYLHENIFNY